MRVPGFVQSLAVDTEIDCAGSGKPPCLPAVAKKEAGKDPSKEPGKATGPSPDDVVVAHRRAADDDQYVGAVQRRPRRIRDGVEIVRKIGKVEMAVTVDQHLT